MFHHVKDLQFKARVSRPDPRFAGLLLEQFGGPNGELKAAIQYFTQSFAVRRSDPKQYDMLMDIATEEFSHLEMVGALITMLMDGVNSEMKDVFATTDLAKMMKNDAKQHMMHQALTNPQMVARSGGGPTVTDCQGVPWNGTYVNANGDLTVDLRSNIAAESRAKIIYEHLLKFTDDEEVRETLGFLMTREIAHLQMFTGALESIQPNFPPGIMQGDPRFTHAYFNMSDGISARGPWNDGRGPWAEDEYWVYIENPVEDVRATDGERKREIRGTSKTKDALMPIEKRLSQERSQKAKPPIERVQEWRPFREEESAAAFDPGL